MLELIKWYIYHVQPTSHPVTGVMFRGRVRKHCLDQPRNIIIDNAQDAEDCVRFAVPSDEDISTIVDYIQSIVPNTEVTLIERGLSNPVLSKLKVNEEDRYE